MMGNGYKIGVRGCQHLGYAARNMRLDRTTGWNQRIVDGHVAHGLIMRDMIHAEVDGIVDGGDLTHWNKPVPRDIEVANRVDDLRVAAGLWAVANSGNHCAGGGADLSAMSIMHRPHLGMNAVYPDPKRGPGDGTGPHPGLYEIHTPVGGLALHCVSHYGLDSSLAGHGIHIDPQPLPGHVNLLFCHGVFDADGRLYQCVNPHGEERPIPVDWARRDWDAVLLSHYHTAGPVPGFDKGAHGQVWYTGSALTRGFSDETGPRGWLLVTIHDTGRVVIELRTIWQRPQFDLPAIDATELSIADLDDIVIGNIGGTTLEDEQSALISGDGGAIVRQVIRNTVPAQRQALSARSGRYANLTRDAAWWSITYEQRTNAPALPSGSRSARNLTRRFTDFGAELRLRSGRLAEAVKVPHRLHRPVLEQAASWADEINSAADLAETDRQG
jgi:DNA repair exonuclease SbcCD nuclease subunit